MQSPADHAAVKHGVSFTLVRPDGWAIFLGTAIVGPPIGAAITGLFGVAQAILAGRLTEVEVTVLVNMVNPMVILASYLIGGIPAVATGILNSIALRFVHGFLLRLLVATLIGLGLTMAVSWALTRGSMFAGSLGPGFFLMGITGGLASALSLCLVHYFTWLDAGRRA